MNTPATLPQPLTQSPATMRANLNLHAHALPELAVELLALIEHARQMEQVLKFYAKEANYDGFGAIDGGARARAVLNQHLN